MKTKIFFILALLVLSSMVLTQIPVNFINTSLSNSERVITNEGSFAASQLYWGSSQSDKFHYPSCRWAHKIKHSNLIVFKSRQEALNAGYVPCKVCRP